MFMCPAYILRDLAQETIFQNELDEHTLSKRMSARSTLVQFIFILSILAVGTIAEVFSARLVYISALYGSYQLLFKNKRIKNQENLHH